MQPLEATLDCVPQMFRPTILYPLVRPGTLKPGFSRDQKICGIWMKRLGDETLANYRAVGVGGVDEIDSQLNRTPQDCDCLGMIGRFSPDAIAGELHCAEPEPANWNIATNQKCSACFSGARMCFCCIGLFHNSG